MGPLCSSLLTLISLLPLTLEYGLTEAACVKTNKSMSIVPQFSTQSEAEVPSTLDTVAEESSSSKKETSTQQVSNDKSVTSSYPDKKAKDISNTRIQDGGATEDKVDFAASGTTEEEPVSNSKFYYSLDSAMKTSLSETSSLSSEKQADDIPDFITAVQMTPSDAGLPLQLFKKVTNNTNLSMRLKRLWNSNRNIIL